MPEGRIAAWERGGPDPLPGIEAHHTRGRFEVFDAAMDWHGVNFHLERNRDA